MAERRRCAGREGKQEMSKKRDIIYQIMPAPEGWRALYAGWDTHKQEPFIWEEPIVCLALVGTPEFRLVSACVKGDSTCNLFELADESCSTQFVAILKPGEHKEDHQDALEHVIEREKGCRP